MQYFLLSLCIFALMTPFVFSQTEKTVTPEVIEMSGDASSVVNLLQQVLEGSQKENINQHFRGNQFSSISYRSRNSLQFEPSMGTLSWNRTTINKEYLNN